MSINTKSYSKQSKTLQIGINQKSGRYYVDNLTYLKSKIDTLKSNERLDLYEYVLGASAKTAKSAAAELEFTMMADYHDYLLRASTIDNMLSKRKKQHEGMADLDELMGDGSWMA